MSMADLIAHTKSRIKALVNKQERDPFKENSMKNMALKVSAQIFDLYHQDRILVSHLVLLFLWKQSNTLAKQKTPWNMSSSEIWHDSQRHKIWKSFLSSRTVSLTWHGKENSVNFKRKLAQRYFKIFSSIENREGDNQCNKKPPSSEKPNDSCV